MSEKESSCNIYPIYLEKRDSGTMLVPDAYTIELDPLHVFDQTRRKIWIQHEIANILEKETMLFTEYLETSVPTQTNTQREKKLKEYHHIINTLNQTLPNWTDITHDTSQMRIINDQQETIIENLTTQIPENNTQALTTPLYLLADMPQPYYKNGTFFYKTSDIQKHLTYINFDPVQPSIISLYQKAVNKGITPSLNQEFQNEYITGLLGYMNAVKMLYKTLTMGELIKQTYPKNANIHLLLEELVTQITHHALSTYIQKSGIVFPLQTVTIGKKNSYIFSHNGETIKDVLWFLSIGADKKKKYDGMAQHQADQELGADSIPQNNRYKQTNDLLRRLSENGYDFLPSKKHGFACITDEQTKSDVDCELDITVFEGTPSTWQKVWQDMKNGELDELLDS